MEPGGGGGGQDFRLTWVNYSQKLTEAFNKFLSRETLCNVTLSVNRRSIKAHQVGSSLDCVISRVRKVSIMFGLDTNHHIIELTSER